MEKQFVQRFTLDYETLYNTVKNAFVAGENPAEKVAQLFSGSSEFNGLSNISKITRIYREVEASFGAKFCEEIIQALGL